MRKSEIDVLYFLKIFGALFISEGCKQSEIKATLLTNNKLKINIFAKKQYFKKKLV
jgi:hypothetical protein